MKKLIDKMTLMASFMAALMLLFSCGPITPEPDPEPGPIGGSTLEDLRYDDVVKVLFIGNSHTLDATDFLPMMLNHEGIRRFDLTRVFHGGYYLVGYNAYYTMAKNVSIMTWRPGQYTWMGETSQLYSLKDAVEAESYDIVVLQEYSGNSHCWKWDSAERDAIKGLVQKIRKSSPKAKLFYMFSHCFSTDYDVLVNNFENDHVKQFETCVRENGSHVMDPSEGFPFEAIISTGALVENLRTSALNVENGMDLLRGDFVHLDYGMTRIAASLLFWKHLVTPITGVAPEDVTFRFKEYYPSANKRATPFIDENRQTVLAAVNAAYEKPLEITDMSSYTTLPSYKHVPGVDFLDMTGVDVTPVTFPVKFNTGYVRGLASNTTYTQSYWRPFGVWRSVDQKAFCKYVCVSEPVKGLIYEREFATASDRNISSPSLTEVYTGDYFEFVLPVRNIAPGTTIRVEAPFYTRQGPVFWYLDYLDGDEWKCNHSEVSSWDGSYTRDATFAIGYEKTAVSCDVTYENGVQNGFLRFRFRCADGNIQADSAGAIERTEPINNGKTYTSVFYFWGNKPELTFSIVK